ncbi:MAG TPA: helix-turn-helix domain-containing protein [Nitratidesulfovibrio sp.]|nr:helix-turn-helix domain-containing protein [Nitratidesulfovibrio sp.]
MATLIDDVVKLVRHGWRPYQGTVEAAVYERLRCPRAPLPAPGATRRTSGPYWFHRADVFLCIGCGRRCSLNRPDGFAPPLPIRYPYSRELPFTLTPQEMVTRLRLLNVNQAAYCLNASASQIYHWIAEGRLRRLKDSPVRVPAEDVQAMMEDWEE